MDHQFGLRHRDGPVEIGARPEEVIAQAINRGWIIRGIKLGIGFWLAGLIVAVVPVLVIIAAASFLTQAGSLDLMGISEPEPEAVLSEPVIQGDQLQVEVHNPSTTPIISLTIGCRVTDAFAAGSFTVSAPPGSLPAGERRLVTIPFGRDVSDIVMAQCHVS